MRFIQETTPDSGSVLIRTTTVSMTEQELNWLIEGLDALVSARQGEAYQTRINPRTAA